MTTETDVRLEGYIKAWYTKNSEVYLHPGYGHVILRRTDYEKADLVHLYGCAAESIKSMLMVIKELSEQLHGKYPALGDHVKITSDNGDFIFHTIHSDDGTKKQLVVVPDKQA